MDSDPTQSIQQFWIGLELNLYLRSVWSNLWPLHLDLRKEGSNLRPRFAG